MNKDEKRKLIAIVFGFLSAFGLLLIFVILAMLGKLMEINGL